MDRTAINVNDVAKWQRPAVDFEKFNASPCVEFETVDVKSAYVTPSHVSSMASSLEAKGSGNIPRISVYGVTPEGHSICANVWNFHPYFYIRSQKKLRNPSAIQAATDGIAEKLENMLDNQRWYSRDQWRKEQEAHKNAVEEEQARAILNGETESRKRSRLDGGFVENRSQKRFHKSDPGTCVVAVEHTELVSGVDPLQRSWSFFRVTLRTPNMIGKARDYVGQGLYVDSAGVLDEVTYESNVVFENRFMIDRGITGAGWTRIDEASYRLRPDAEKTSTCQVEIDLDWRHIHGLAVEDEENREIYERPSKLRVISYDIECKGKPNKFPDAKEDPSIQIAAVGWTHGDPEAREECKVLFTLGGCDPIAGTRVVCAETEAQLIDNFATFLHYYDPDIVIGYNTKGFDDAYLFDRATKLGAKRYLAHGRDTEREIEKREDNRMSRNYGNRQGYNVNVVGRIGFDMLPFVKENKKLRSYTLNAVSAALLGDQKEDLHHSMIAVLQDGDDSDRRRLGVYCVKDVILPKLLSAKMLAISALMETARMTGVQMRQIQDQGSSIKVMLNVLRKTRQRGVLMPFMPNQEKLEYEGANVFTPIPGFYTRPVAVLDFSSLYPSIMIAHNLCFSTHVPPDKLHLFDPNDLERCPEGHYYVKREKRVGILTEVLEGLLSQRSAYKAAMNSAEEAGDTAKADSYNCRQLAAKVLANSVYGWTGLSTSVYFWFCADSTTAYGREQIRLTQRLVEEQYTKANGYPFDAKVIYGDTDSVMVYLDIPIDGDELDRDNPDSKPTPSAATREAIAEAIKYAHEIAAYCTDHFAKPNKLEFENIYWPYLLLDKKKRYAGPFWTNAEGPSYTKIRGLESVRRDNCLAATNAQKTALNYILDELDPDKAFQHVCDVLKRLRRGEMDHSELIISQRLNARQHNMTVDERKRLERKAKKVYMKEKNWPERQNRTRAQLTELKKAAAAEVKKICQERGVYATMAPHAELDKRLHAKTGMGYNINDRVPYIVVDRGTGKKTRVFEKAEDPIVVLEQNMQPDLEYYTDKIAESASKVLAPVYEKRYQHQTISSHWGAEPNKDFELSEKARKSLTRKEFGDETVSKLKNGPHMIKVRRYTKIAEDSIFSRAFTPMPKCVGCTAAIPVRPGVRLKPEDTPRLCDNCRPDALSIYLKEMEKYRQLEMEFSRLWTRCQECQGDYHREISCSAISCPIFFKRTVVKNEFQKQRRVMDWNDW